MGDYCSNLIDFLNKSNYGDEIAIGQLTSEELLELSIIDAISIWDIPVNRVDYKYTNNSASGFYNATKVCDFNLGKDVSIVENDNCICYKENIKISVIHFDNRRSITNRCLLNTLDSMLLLSEHYRTWLFSPQELFKKQVIDVGSHFNFESDEIYKLVELIKL